MKVSIASGDSAGSGPAQQGPSGGAMPGETGAAADAAQRKALASSPAEAHTGVLSQVWLHPVLPWSILGQYLHVALNMSRVLTARHGR